MYDIFSTSRPFWANRLIAKAVAKDVEDNDIVWVHDYHLMLMPAMLQEEFGKTKNRKYADCSDPSFLSTGAEAARGPVNTIKNRLSRHARQDDAQLGDHTHDDAPTGASRQPQGMPHYPGHISEGTQQRRGHSMGDTSRVARKTRVLGREL
ncbi:glycosyltransferase family 20 protein [Plenodomus tracheiphilus IPT5]|uniref:Glycosyltransferase family 20 protein n=1 Tax=Plenodomus tracheiphilus IPT5 TaxID=1408161 RepID=A0A6A7B218_9PLEO|nr:glycosyltransferase family 20 protein [Plenodomus tracheiphilus IPT5]